MRGRLRRRGRAACVRPQGFGGSFLYEDASYQIPVYLRVGVPEPGEHSQFAARGEFPIAHGMSDESRNTRHNLLG